jgi:hypothetical protein
MSVRTTCVPMGDQHRRNAVLLLSQVDRILEHGVEDEDGITYDGMSVRIDDGGTGHAGFVTTLRPHDTGPFSDRLGEGRVHVLDPVLLASIEGSTTKTAVAAIMRTTRHAMTIAGDVHDTIDAERIAAQGAAYARLTACETSLARGGSIATTMIAHGWMDVPGSEWDGSTVIPLRIPLPPLLSVDVSWDAVDTDVVVQGLHHHASFTASEDPVEALRLTKILRTLLHPETSTEPS